MHNTIRQFPIGKSLTQDIRSTLEQLYRTESVLITGSSLQSGRQMFLKPEDYADWCTQLCDLAHQQLNEHVEVANCWATRGDPGSYHTLHHHQNYQGRRIAWSMITYIDIPESCSNAWGPDGNTVFVTDRSVEEVVPTTGQAVLFPSNTVHGVYPHREGVRMCFNLDFRTKT